MAFEDEQKITNELLRELIEVHKNRQEVLEKTELLPILANLGSDGHTEQARSARKSRKLQKAIEYLKANPDALEAKTEREIADILGLSKGTIFNAKQALKEEKENG